MQQAVTSEPADRYARQRILPGFGDAAQARIERARVLVIGAGGLGSTVIPALAAAGVGSVADGAIGIIDDDDVETSNLHRQYLHGTADVGGSKVGSAAAAVAALNAATRVIGFEQRLTAGNALEIFAQFELVVDGSDNFVTRYLADDAAALTEIPLIWGAVSQYGGQAGVCWAHKGPHYRDLFPTPPNPSAVQSCSVDGVLPTVCAVIGSIMANETLKILGGVGTPLFGRVTSFDALSGRFRELAYERDPLAAPITGLIDYELFCGIRQESEDSIDPAELAAELETERRPRLLDVRERWEAELATLAGSTLLPLDALETALAHGHHEFAAEEPIVVFCHHGSRSGRALELLRRSGFRSVRNLTGGIDAWSRQIDPSIARY